MSASVPTAPPQAVIISGGGHPNSGTADVHRDLGVLLARLNRARVDGALAFEHVDQLLYRCRAAQQEFVVLESAIAVVREDDTKLRAALIKAEEESEIGPFVLLIPLTFFFVG
jgi:hypothetical protein